MVTPKIIEDTETYYYTKKNIVLYKQENKVSNEPFFKIDLLKKRRGNQDEFQTYFKSGKVVLRKGFSIGLSFLYSSNFLSISNLDLESFTYFVKATFVKA